MTQLQPTRRAFLRSAGVCLGLPFLESVDAQGAAPKKAPAPSRRMVAMCFAMGLHGPNLFPEQTGRGYTPTRYLQALGQDILPEITVMSGLSHPDVTLGHASDKSFLTAAPHPGGDTFRNTISLDQFMVEQLRPPTRFPSLVLGTSYLGSLSFSRMGVQIPTDTRPSVLFTKLFVNGSKSEMAAQVRRLKEGQSVLDTVLGPTKRLYKQASAPDRQRLAQYYSAVREVEQQLVSNQEWAKKPKLTVNYPQPQDISDPNDGIGRLKLMLDLVHLALQTDSTRFITLVDDGFGTIPTDSGVRIGYHELCHHGQDPAKISQLGLIQTQQMECVGGFLQKLKSSKEDGETLLDRTAVMFGSAMGNASSHNCTNLPIVLAGGGFRHGQHLAFDQKHNTPLGRLFVSLMQRMGIEADQFVSGKGTLPGLELA